jgi:hypothetical protein
LLFGYLGAWERGDLRANPLEVEEVLWLTPGEGANHPDGLPTNPDFIAAVTAAKVPCP